MRNSSKAVPFLLGTVFAGALFAFFFWDLWHHYVPYSPKSSPSLAGKLFPLFVWLGVVFLQIGVPWLRRIRSRSWPWVECRVEGCSIEQIQRRGRQSCVVRVNYSYLVNGGRYGGVHAEEVATASDALALVNSVKGLPPSVRYKPDDPFESQMNLQRDASLS
jgi:hypothetical protein